MNEDRSGSGMTSARMSRRDNAPSKRREASHDIWVAAGIPAFLMVAYVFVWITSALERARSCESMSQSVFAPERCAEAGMTFGPAIIGLAYAWSILSLVAFIVMKRWGSAGVMAVILALLTMMHVGIWVVTATVM